MTLRDAVGLILAGGAARRMGGGDKTLRPLAGRPILSHIIDRLRPQVARLVLNANGDPARFAAFGLPVIADTLPGQPGPLAGILAGLAWCGAQLPAARWLLCVPGDTPFLPADLAARLLAAIDAAGAPLAIAASAGRAHPVVGLWSVNLASELRNTLAAGEHKVGAVTTRLGAAMVAWPDAPRDPFSNVNTPADLDRAEQAWRSA